MNKSFITVCASAIVAGNPAEPLLPVGVAIPVIALLTYICCAVTTRVVSLLPGSKWIIG